MGKSIFEFDRNLCIWNDDLQSCSFNKNDSFFNWLTFAVAFIITLVIAVPLRVIINFMFEVVLRAPTKSYNDTDDDDKIRKQSFVAVALRRASHVITNIVHKINDRMKTLNTKIISYY